MSYNSKTVPFFVRKNSSNAAAAADGFDLSNLDACMAQVEEEAAYMAVGATHDEKRWKQANSRRLRSTKFGWDTVWLPGKPPRYWGETHRRIATEAARKLGVDADLAGRAIAAYLQKVGRTDEKGFYGPTIAALLQAVKAWGARRFFAFTEEGFTSREGNYLISPNYSGYITLEKLGWLARQGYGFSPTYHGWEKPEINAHYVYFSQPLSARRMRYRRLILNLRRFGIKGYSIPFSILRGMDRLGARSFRIARALLIKAKYEKVSVKPEAFFKELAGMVRGEISQSPIMPYMPKGDVLHHFGVEDTTDGVTCLRAEAPSLEKMNVAVYRMFIDAKEAGWLVQSANGHTYHVSSEDKVDVWNWHDMANDALHQAIRAWKQQDVLIREQADLVGFLKGELGYCPLIYRDDSYDAGNCRLGTESWIEEKEWANREFIPSIWLIPLLGEWRVKNVAMRLYREATETAQAA